MLIACAGGILDLALAIATFPVLSQTGIALAAALAGWFNALALALLLWQSGRWSMSLPSALRLLRLALASGIMGLCLHAASGTLQLYLQAARPLFVKLGTLSLLVFGGLAVFLLACWMLRCFNWREWRAAG